MIPFPDKKYQIIYADPPWDKGVVARRLNKPVHYSLMSTKEICNLPVSQITNKDCILFLWVIDLQLSDGLKVISSWDFKYVTVGFTWVKKTASDKDHFGMGSWTRNNPEMCLIAIKGNIKRIDAGIRQLQYHLIREHSRKPDEIRNKIIHLCGDLPRIELFARIQYPGWDAWGNEVITLAEYNKRQKETEDKRILDSFELSEKLNSSDFADLIV